MLGKKKIIDSRKLTGYLFLVLPVLIYSVFFIAPNVAALYNSFFQWNGLSSEKPFVGLANFRKLFSDRVFLMAFANTIKYTVTLVIFQTLFGFILAILVYKESRVHNVFRTIYFLPAIMATTTVGLIWGFIYDPNFGALNEFLRIIGLSSLRKSWLSDEKIVIYAITAVHVWIGIGQSVVLFIAGLQNVPTELYESASLDGASSWKQLINITIPLIRSTTVIVLVLTTIGGFKAFDFVYVMTNGGATHTSEVLSTLLYKEAYAYSDVGLSSAISVVLLLVVSIITFIQLFAMRKKD